MPSTLSCLAMLTNTLARIPHKSQGISHNPTGSFGDNGVNIAILKKSFTRALVFIGLGTNRILE